MRFSAEDGIIFDRLVKVMLPIGWLYCSNEL